MFKLNLAQIDPATRKADAPVVQGTIKVVFVLPDQSEVPSTEEFALHFPVEFLKAYLDRTYQFNFDAIDLVYNDKVLFGPLSLIDVGFVGGQTAKIEIRRAEDAPVDTPLQRTEEPTDATGGVEGDQFGGEDSPGAAFVRNDDYADDAFDE